MYTHTRQEKSIFALLNANQFQAKCQSLPPSGLLSLQISQGYFANYLR